MRLLPRKFAFLFALIITTVSAWAAPRVTRVEPPTWWTGFVSPVMVLVYGENLAGASVSVTYPGVTLTKVDIQSQGKYAFVWLDIKAGTQPGKVPITIRTASGTATANLELLPRASTQGRFQGVNRNDVIYLIMPDRFADGDSANNTPNGASPGTYDRKAPKAYHGGDLRGIQQHLPYLKELGITTIWLNPIFDNDNAAEGYHGYSGSDLYAVEDHFGTVQDFQNLVTAAHGQGMKILLDMVPNHVGPKHPWAKSQPTPGWLHGTVEDHVPADYFAYAYVADLHSVESNYRKSLDGWFADVLPDLNQDNPLVAQYLLQNAYWWMETGGVDGFRIDTFPYVPRTFWASYLQGLTHTYPNFFAVGEVYNFEPAVVSYFAGGQTGFDGLDTHLNTPFDFPMESAIREVVNHGGSPRKIVEVLRQDRLYPHPELLVTFIGNHDMTRFYTDSGGSLARQKLGLGLLATLRGIPQFYAGDEIAMPGGDDPDSRRDFPGGFPGDSRDAFTSAGRTPEEQATYAYLQTLLKLRQEHPALRLGQQKHLAVSDDYYLFTREAADEKLLIVFYKGEAAKDMEVDLSGTSIAGSRQFVPLTASPAAAAQGNKLSLQLAPQSVAIYKVN